MAILGPGAPLRIGAEYLWDGQDRSNGFIMESVDANFFMLKESVSSLTVDAANVLAPDGLIPYGNGIWRDLSQYDVRPGNAYAQGGTNRELIGVLRFNQSEQTMAPAVANWGMPTYGKISLLRAALVGYKVCKAVGATAQDYLDYLKGDRTKDIPSVRTTSAEWLQAVSSGTAVAGIQGTGRHLAVAFEVATGFPVMVAYDGVTWGAPATLEKGGDVVTVEPENKVVFIDLKAKLGGTR